jgi:hypothetical protein
MLKTDIQLPHLNSFEVVKTTTNQFRIEEGVVRSGVPSKVREVTQDVIEVSGLTQFRGGWPPAYSRGEEEILREIRREWLLRQRYTGLGL